jgi:heterodisulfide reductase subunit A
VFEEKGKLKVWGVDTLTGKDVEIEADMVVLAMAMRPSKGMEELTKKLKIAVDKDGFLAEAHPKLRPVESVTAGMFLAGAAQAPKDIPEAVAQASGAAAKAVTILSQEKLFHSPTVAEVNVNLCTGCGMCVDVCPYEAITLKENKAEVNDVLCEGCGTCAATCLRAAIQTKNLTPLQVHEMIKASVGG